MMDQGNLMKPKPIKTQKTNKKETTIELGNPFDSEIPEWLQEFREIWWMMKFREKWSYAHRQVEEQHTKGPKRMVTKAQWPC